MYKCQCGKEFNNHSARNAHQVAHKNRPERYSVSRVSKKKDLVFHQCVYCNIDFSHRKNTENKFCSMECFAKNQWENISIPKIEKGLGGNCKRYLKEKFGEQCTECGQEGIWNNKPLVLQLDHIDGNSDNNLPNNLRLLCPNCHTQTETFGNGGLGNRYKKDTKRNTYLQEYKKRPDA